MKKLRLLLFAALLSIGSLPLCAQQLFVGANYHPHDDKNPEKIARDIRLMQEAGFNVTRLGHLAWDSFEPSDGVFDFEWFDRVMDGMAEAGIKVILDLAVRPAPIWLHRLYPSIDVTDASGNRLYPNHRYMDDVGDPMYQKYALRFVDAVTKRYARHPALLAFGIDNEPGDGPISYSETVRQRFVHWLEQKYGTVDALNKAWAAQRWSRWMNKFDEVGLPMSGQTQGAPERMLDFRRFVSDELNGFYKKMMDLVNANAPGVLLNTNAWYYSPLKYFDYAPIAYSGQLTRQGCGFYPGGSLKAPWGLMNSLYGIFRIQFESENPFWCNEFTTVTAVPGSIRRSAYATLMYGNQMVCGWTWQSMHGGEEQYLEGMLDWDGVPNRKYEEYKQIASEFKKIAPYLPYRPKADVGIAYSFDSQMASASFPESHDSQVQSCFNLFFDRNIDVKMLDVLRPRRGYGGDDFLFGHGGRNGESVFHHLAGQVERCVRHPRGRIRGDGSHERAFAPLLYGPEDDCFLPGAVHRHAVAPLRRHRTERRPPAGQHREPAPVVPHHHRASLRQGACHLRRPACPGRMPDAHLGGTPDGTLHPTRPGSAPLGHGEGY